MVYLYMHVNGPEEVVQKGVVSEDNKNDIILYSAGTKEASLNTKRKHSSLGYLSPLEFAMKYRISNVTRLIIRKSSEY